MMAVGNDYTKVAELEAEKGKIQIKVDELYAEWEELEALMA